MTLKNNNDAQQISYPIEQHPAPGETIEIVPGVRWLSMPMPGSLGFINLYLLRDHHGWWIVDTGLSNEQTAELWQSIFTNDLARRSRGGCHLHPHAPGPYWPGAHDYRAISVPAVYDTR